jgi:hypothetical protein
MLHDRYPVELRAAVISAVVVDGAGHGMRRLG